MNPRPIQHRAYPANIVAQLRALASERADDTALIVVRQKGDSSVEKKFDYGTLDQLVRALAAVLQNRFAPGERALLLLDNDEHYVIAFFACLYAGLIAVPVFPPESVRERHIARLLGIASDAEAHCILTTAEILPLIKGAALEQFAGATVLAVDTVKPDEASTWCSYTPSLNDIAFLQYTSGSTSTPKGVMVSHGNLMTNARVFEEGMSINANDIFVSWLPLYHDMGLIGGLLQPIHRGIPVVLMTPRFFIERPVRWLQVISHYRATVSGAPNFAFQLCADRVSDAQLQELDLSSWRVAFSGAEPVRRETMRAFIERFASAGFPPSTIYPCYGLAEATLFVTGGTRGDGMEAHCFSTGMLAQGRAEVAETGTSLVACGVPASGHTVRVVDPETYDQLPDGAVGEIWTDGASLACGYWRRPEETAETFVSHEGGRWLRTGDLGFIHDTQLYIAGRRKDLIIIRGQNIYPQDIEQAVEEEVEAIRKGRVAAFSVAQQAEVALNGAGEGIGIAVEVSRNMQKLVSVETLVKALGEAVSASCHEALSVVVLLNPGALPKTSSGKLQRAACRQGWRERTLDAYAIYEYGRYVLGGCDQPVQKLTDEVEIALASIWEKVLNRAELGREDHFFASGGNSLLAVQSSVRIGDHWHIDFPVRSLFDNPRLRECATEIRRLLSTGTSRPKATISVLPASSRGNPHDALPLSFAQQRLWFLWQLDPSSTAYHISHALRLSGPLDVQALRTSFNGLIGRHESLRTLFRPGANGSPEQVIRMAAPFDIAHIDLHDGLRGASSSEREVRAAEEAQRIVSAPFDLSEGPLLRVAVIRVAQDENILVMAMHHIISDGASMQILIEELTARYRTQVQGIMPHFDPLPIRYADFAVWQRNWLENGEKDRQLNYWRDYLGDDHPVLTLPADHPRQAIANYHAARYNFNLPQEVLNGLRSVAGDRGATLFMALLAGFQALLHRYTGQQDIRVGVPVANRNRTETTGLIGFFVNTQVLRSRLHGRMPLVALLEEVREGAIDAQAHQDLPFEQLVEALQPERSLSHSPLFQVTINHLPTDHRTLMQLPGLTVVDYPLPQQAAQFELTLETVESTDGNVRGSFIYAAELFDSSTVERLARSYIDVLHTLAEHPGRTIGDIPLLSDSDLLQLNAWGTNESHRFRLPAFEPVHRVIERQAEQRPDAIAVISGETEITYAELNRRSNRHAHRLIELGVKPEVKVGIAVERSLEMIVGLLAILKAGGAYVPLDPEYPRDRLAFMLEDSGIRLLLTQSHLSTRIPQSAGVEVVEVMEEDRVDLSVGIDTNPNIALHSDNLAYVIYTSGSTGRPKGVAVAHGPLAMHLAAIMEIYDVQPGGRELMFFSMNFDAAVEQWMTPLCGGAAIVLPSARNLASDSFATLIAAHRITTLHLPPAYLRLLLPLMPGPSTSRSSVRTCIAGGEAWFASDLAATAAAFPNVRLVNAYGPTETIITPAAWVRNQEALSVGNGREGFTGDFAPIGGPVGKRSLYVLDEELNLVPPGSIGELYVGGMGLARGYLDRPALTSQRFVADPFSREGGRLYRTGDLVRWRSDGQLEYIGRLDQQIKVRGFRVEIGEIEAQLLTQTGVRDAVVLAQESSNGVRVIAYVAGHKGILLNAAMLKTALGNVLPDYMLPSAIVLLEALPLTPNGKVDRKALPQPEQLGQQDYEAPVSSMETTVAEIWAEILALPPVGLHNNFFDLGGHSLLLIKVQCKLEERLNIRIAIIDLFKYTTVASLAKFLDPGDRREDKGHLSLQHHQERAQRQRATFIQRKLRAGRTH